MNQTIENEVKSFLDKCFLKVGSNTVYSTLVIARLLMEAAKMQEYLKEVADKPDSDSVFKRIEHATLDLIKKSFEVHVRELFHKTGDFFKRGEVILRGRKDYTLESEIKIKHFHSSGNGDLIKLRNWYSELDKCRLPNAPSQTEGFSEWKQHLYGI